MLLAGLGLGLALAAGACGHAPAAPDTVSGALAPSTPATLQPLDVVEIRVLGEPETDEYQVNTDGTIQFPHIGRVPVEGKTADLVADEIERRLRADGYFRDPEVTVFVKEYGQRKVTILGQVQKPSTFPYSEGMSILEAISLAGGFTPLAAKNDTVVRRGDQRVRVPVERIEEGKAGNFFLRPGDTVVVPERLF